MHMCTYNTRIHYILGMVFTMAYQTRSGVEISTCVLMLPFKKVAPLEAFQISDFCSREYSTCKLFGLLKNMNLNYFIQCGLYHFQSHCVLIDHSFINSGKCMHKGLNQ